MKSSHPGITALLLPNALTALMIACGGQDESPTAATTENRDGAAPARTLTAATSSTAATTTDTRPAPRLGARAFATKIYEKPKKSSRRLGYLRVGAVVERSATAVSRRGCKGGWYAIKPRGYVCAGKDATIDLGDPLLRAAAKRPDMSTPLPYRYGFVRATLPLYLRIPTAEEQRKAEFKLTEHLKWFKEHKHEIQTAPLGANDVAIDDRGVVLRGKRLGELGRRENSTELTLGELFGGQSDDDPPPFWLRNGRRLIPNISDFDVPQYADFADRARRHTGLAFIGSFKTGPHSYGRRFAVTTDLRLAPTTKVKPDSGSPFYGIELGKQWRLPLAFVNRRGAQAYRITNSGEATTVGDVPRRSVHPLAGKKKLVDGDRYYLLKDGRWLRGRETSLLLSPSKFPKVARKGGKWIEIDLSEQVLVMWEGRRPVYATLVSTGRPAIGDPKKTTATPRGHFRVLHKHISATMDSDEGSGRRLNREKKLKPGDEGYVPTRGDGVYGVSKRRGEGLFKLRDVPHIQYFDKNYAIHGAYWHDVFGIPRSHGCINLAPVDSHRLFLWTEPQVPAGWHGVKSDRGTPVIIHK